GRSSIQSVLMRGATVPNHIKKGRPRHSWLIDARTPACPRSIVRTKTCCHISEWLYVDCAILIEGPTRIMCDFPDVTLRIGKRACRASPVRHRCVSDDPTSSALGVSQEVGHLLS